jgi:hypothetical protein
MVEWWSGVSGAGGFWPPSYIVKKGPVNACKHSKQYYIASLVYNIFNYSCPIHLYVYSTNYLKFVLQYLMVHLNYLTKLLIYVIF